MSRIGLALAIISFVAVTSRVAAADTDTPKPRSRETAFALSIGGSALSLGLVVAGAETNNGTMVGVGLASSLVTPALGEMYAGKPVTVGMGIRAGSAVVELVGLQEAFKCFLAEGGCQNNDAAAGVMIVTGLLGYTGGTIYDIVTAGSAVDEFNKEHDLHITPTVIRGAPGSVSAGMEISGRF